MIATSNRTARPGKTRSQRSYGQTRKKLLDAAKSVMATKGLAATTVEDITERADVGRGSFYYHFDDKEKMIQVMMEKLLKELVAALKEGCAPHTEINEVLDAMIGTHIKFFSNRWEDFVLYFQGRADIMLNESLEGIETPFLDYLSCIEELIDGAIAEPISDERLKRLAYALAGFVSGYYSFASVASEEDNIDESFMALRSAFVASLARFIQVALP